VAAIIAIIAVAGAVYLPLTTTTTTPVGTSYTTQHNFPTTYSSTSTTNSQLQINLNTSKIQYGGHLSVKIELFNPSSESVSLNVNYSNNQTILNWNSKDFLCSLGPVQNLFGFALYQGYYTSQNISTASNQLVLAPSAGIGCPTTYQPNISKVTIAPGSDSANFSNGNSQNLEINATTESCRTQGQGYECGGGASLYGFWTSPPANKSCNQIYPLNQTAPHGMYYPPNCNLVSFPVGSYTLVSQDLWNHTVYAYFQVVNQSGLVTPVSISATINSSIIQRYSSALKVTVTVQNNGSTTIEIPSLYNIVRSATVIDSSGSSMVHSEIVGLTNSTS
jgi:hypothetical protein